MNSEFVISGGACHKLELAGRRHKWTSEDVEWLSSAENGLAVPLLRTRRAKLVMVDEVPDTIICVDRSIRLFYPDWMKAVMHLELETVGPVEYDLAKVELYLHNKQKDGKRMQGTQLYDHLKDTGSLKSCLGLHDALEIQKKGLVVFRKLFGVKAVYCWKSVVRDCEGNLRVPCVCGGSDKVVLLWGWLCNDWHDGSPAARFPS